MSFGSITTASGTFQERARGVYISSNVGFGAPSDEFRLRPNTNPKNPNMAITRFKQFDYTEVSGAVTRVGASVQLSIQIPPKGLTSADIAILVDDLRTFVTAGTLTRLAQGES